MDVSVMGTNGLGILGPKVKSFGMCSDKQQRFIVNVKKSSYNRKGV